MIPAKCAGTGNASMTKHWLLIALLMFSATVNAAIPLVFMPQAFRDQFLIRSEAGHWTIDYNELMFPDIRWREGKNYVWCYEADRSENNSAIVLTFTSNDLTAIANGQLPTWKAPTQDMIDRCKSALFGNN